MKRHSLRLLLAPCLALACTAAMAQSSPYYIGVAQTLAHNSNLVALRDNQPVPAGLSKSDTVSSTALVAGIDQPFGRQRLTGTANLSSNRYSRNSEFNSSGYALRLGLDWQTIERLSGRVSGRKNANRVPGTPAAGTRENVLWPQSAAAL